MSDVTVHALLALSLFAAGVTPARAQNATGRAAVVVAPQPARAVLEYGYVSLTAGYQGTSHPFSNAWSYPSNLETASINASYAVKAARLLDAGAGLRLIGPLTIGAAVSRYRESGSTSVTASVPHPLFFNQPRTVKGASTSGERSETAVHVQAMYTVAASRRVLVGMFGGPSLYRVGQALLSSVAFNDAYPYETVTIADTTAKNESKKKIGFNVGVDVTCMIRGRLGVGGLVRYSGVTAAFTAPDGSALSLKAGGIHAGVGLRLRF